MNNWQLVQYGLSLTADGYRQLSFINRFLQPLVNKHTHRLHYQLNPTEKKKVLFYYPMYTVLACAQMYVAIKGRGLTINERKRLTLVGAMATICDDLVDEDGWTRDEIFHLLSTDLDETGLAPKAQLLVSLNNELKAFWPVTEKYYQQLKIALEWQAVSNKQQDPAISLDEIVRICREKNGNTSLMFASLVDEDWTENELQFIYQSAIVGQLTNDSFDIYFDTQAGIKTYFNTAPSIKQVRQFFLDECQTLHQMVLSTDNQRQHQMNTIRRMSVLHGFTLTAIDHLQETEHKYGAPVDWNKATRQEMITDMWKNKNRLRTLKHIKELAKNI
ncbi:class 1 isoprenoid biosynthesis enzyme [Aridibaculum aurantiacum]|uniref:class 1 isoprenoid biosynthesis enzyme n=1 Tax=Aridibaculum aurantiacum TaxID=2810307 RepID=UPI001A95AC68|nr:class 1 isoprenoid biosynthesis enzyme [Aridibaculum aurantiacum]